MKSFKLTTGKDAENIDIKNSQIFKGIASILIFFGIIWYFFGGGLNQHVAHDMKVIQDQVADDIVSQYNIAKRGGDQIQVCVHAGFVSAAYLQAQDESEYQKWLKIEKEECTKAGLR